MVREKTSGKTTMCPEKHLESNLFQKKCWKKYVFWFNNEVFGTVAKIFFRLAKTPITVQRIKLTKTLSYKTKLAVLCRFWVNFFSFQRKSSPELSKLQPTKPWNNLRTNIAWNFGHCFKILWTLSQKNKSFIWKKAFQGGHNCHPRVQRIILRKIIFSRNFFLYQIWSSGDFSVAW